MTGLSPKDLAFWPFFVWDCKDLVSTQVGNAVPMTGYIKDSGSVFVYVDCKLQSRLTEADPATFTVPSILFPRVHATAKETSTIVEPRLLEKESIKAQMLPRKCDAAILPGTLSREECAIHPASSSCTNDDRQN